MKVISENIKPILALIVVLSAVIYIFCTTFITQKSSDSQGLIAMIAFGNLGLGYYLGTSTGAAKKDEIISKLSEK